MPRRELPERKPARKSRLETIIYRHADELEKVVSNPEAFPDATYIIGHVMCELEGASGVGTDHPALIRAAYLESVRALHRAQEAGDKKTAARIGKCLDHLDSLAHFAGVPAECRRVGSYYDPEEYPDEEGEYDGPEGERRFREALNQVRIAEGLEPLADDEPTPRPHQFPKNAQVVDLNIWRQSRPRPVRSLIFAEKGGDDE